MSPSNMLKMGQAVKSVLFLCNTNKFKCYLSEHVSAIYNAEGGRATLEKPALPMSPRDLFYFFEGLPLQE